MPGVTRNSCFFFFRQPPATTPRPAASPFFSYTYELPNLQPLCFQIHARNGGVYTPLTQWGKGSLMCGTSRGRSLGDRLYLAQVQELGFRDGRNRPDRVPNRPPYLASH